MLACPFWQVILNIVRPLIVFAFSFMFEYAFCKMRLFVAYFQTLSFNEIFEVSYSRFLLSQDDV